MKQLKLSTFLPHSYRRLWRIIGIAIASVYLTGLLVITPVTATQSLSIPVNFTAQTALISAQSELFSIVCGDDS